MFFLSFLVAAYSAWMLLGPTLHSPKNNYLYVKTGSQINDVKSSLLEQKILSNTYFFDAVAKLLSYSKIKPGRYEITNATSLFSLVRKLKSGSQTPVRFVITKLRTKEDLAAKIASNFEVDSVSAIQFLLSNDSLAPFQLDTNTVMSILIPNTYMMWWNSSMKKTITRLHEQQQFFWEGNRTKKAAQKGLTPIQVYTLASIIEEETNKEKDKGLIASVYINRMHKNMKLEADPTVKYALRAFEIKRVLHQHLTVLSPYNTYQIKGLPPGPICTPSIQTIDAVLNAPTTDYLFFVAKPDFSGYSIFTNDYKKHLENAHLYQEALNKLLNQTNE